MISLDEWAEQIPDDNYHLSRAIRCGALRAMISLLALHVEKRRVKPPHWQVGGFDSGRRVCRRGLSRARDPPPLRRGVYIHVRAFRGTK